MSNFIRDTLMMLATIGLTAAVSLNYLATPASSTYEIHGVVSSGMPNSNGFVVVASGADLTLVRPIPVLINHDIPHVESIVGRVVELKNMNGAIVAVMEVTLPAAIADDLERDYLTGISIDVLPYKEMVMGDLRVILVSEIVEISLVTVPADLDARITYWERKK